MKVTGIFDVFKNLDQIPAEDVAHWLHPAPQPTILQNFLANRVLYPQSVPITPQDMQLDLAVLREALKREPTFFDPQNKKIYIPEDFINRIPDLRQLIWVFFDAYLLDNPDKHKYLWTFILRSEIQDQILGTALSIEYQDLSGVVEVYQGKNATKVQNGSLVIVPCPNTRCEVGFKADKAQILGKNEGLLELEGGNLGLIIDARS